jgi:hypothetical protein
MSFLGQLDCVKVALPPDSTVKLSCHFVKQLLHASVTLPAALLAKARREARRRNITLSALVTEVLQENMRASLGEGPERASEILALYKKSFLARKSRRREPLGDTLPPVQIRRVLTA